MQARRLPAERGTWWLLEGFRLFRRNPPLITALTLIYLVLVQGIVSVLPGIGPILLPLALPALTLLVANGCRLVDEGRAPSKETLLLGLRGNGIAMLRLGGLQLAGAVLLVLVNLALSDGNVPDPFAGFGDPGPLGDGGVTAPADPAHEAAMLWALLRLMLLSLPLVLAFWFAPFLTGWEGVSPLKALFFSVVASWRNWRALGMFGLGAVVIAGIVPGFILIVTSQIAGLALSVAFIALRMVLIFLVAPVLTASIYVSYRDIFRPAVDENA
jgi:hypothetical protein